MTTATGTTGTSAAPGARKLRPGSPFQKGNAGKPRGARDRRTIVGIAVCQAMSGQAVETLRALLSSRSGRVRLEAARTILGYSWGLPKATLEVSGAFGDLGRELAEALREARARRAGLEGVVPVAGALTQAPGLPEGAHEAPDAARERDSALDEEGLKTPPICTRIEPAIEARAVAAEVTGDGQRIEEPLIGETAPGEADE